MWELMAGLLLWSLVGGVIPVVNAEAMVVVVAVGSTDAAIPLVAAVATLGQMIAKSGLFLTARWAPARLPERARVALDKGARVIERRPRAVHLVILVSAIVGLPPFYGVSLAAGALRTPWTSFLVLGSIGRALRFGAVAWAATRFGAAAVGFLS